MTLGERLKSRKTWALIFGAISPYLVKAFAGEVEWSVVLAASATAIAAGIFGIAKVDAAEASRNPRATLKP